MSPNQPAATETQQGDPRTYFAAERTLLAWVRTGLSMMGFGFVVARFGLFLREISAVAEDGAPHRFAGSLWIGTALVLLGVIVNLAAAAKHWQTVNQLSTGRPVPLRKMSLATATAIVLGMLGLLIGGYLVFEYGQQVPEALPRPWYNK